MHFEAAIRINPHLFDGYYYYGRAAFSQGQTELSADLFRKASEVRREDFQSAVLLAQSLRMLGRTEESRSANREGILSRTHLGIESSRLSGAGARIVCAQRSRRVAACDGVVAPLASVVSR